MKIRTKASAVILTAVILLSAFSVCGTAFAAETPIPEKYDSRDYGYITPVRNQKSYGTCWAHGTMAACEASLVKNNGFSNDLDLAEYHLAYAATHKMFDRLGLFDSEFFVDPSQKYMSDGQHLDSAAITLAGWNGAVLDSAHKEQFSSKKFDYDGLDQLDFASKELLYSINAVKLTDYVTVEPENLDLIKEYVMQYGGGTFSIRCYWDGIDSDRGVWLVDDRMVDSAGSHAMCIVGWDDTIPASELSYNGFYSQNDGAFIVKNSWGETLGDSGYFYIPYDSFSQPGTSEVYFYTFDSSDKYTYNYGYDDLRGIRYWNDRNSLNSVSASNVYTATDDGETLEAVSFFPYGNEKTYEIKVYTGLPENYDDPESGTLSAVQSGGALENGFCTIPLNEPVSLQSGERFSIVISVTTEGNDKSTDKARFGLNNPDLGEYKDTKADPKRGESYFYTAKNSWQDVCDLGINNTRIRAMTHSDAAAALVEPDDYDSYNGMSKNELINYYDELFGRYNKMTEKFTNYDYDYWDCLSNFNQIYYTVKDNSEVFNASEIYATSANYEYMLDHPVFRKPGSLMENLSGFALDAARGGEYEYPVKHQTYKDYMDEYNRIALMAQNLEINNDNILDVTESLSEKMFELIKYMGSYNDNGLHFGDVNNDGEVNVLDATLIQKTDADLEDNGFYSVRNGDVNTDSNSDILDAVCIQKLCADKIDYLPVYGQTFDVEDGYTADTGKAVIVQYLSDTIEARKVWDGYTPNLYSSLDNVFTSCSYETAKEALADAENLHPAILLFQARYLIANVEV